MNILLILFIPIGYYFFVIFKQASDLVASRCQVFKGDSIPVWYISCALCFFFTVQPVYSHVHSSHSYSKDNLLIAEEIIEQAFALAPEVTEIAKHPKAQAYTKTNTSPYIPFIQVGTKAIPVNSSFWDLVRGWIRLYRHEIEHYCPCDINEEALVKEAKDHIAKGFLRLKVGDPLAHLAEHGTLTLYGYAGRYGRAYAAIIAALEVVEHSLSFVAGGKGLGFLLCNVIQATAFFFVRTAQIYTRAFLNSNTLGENQLLTILRTALLNRIMKKAERKVFFLLETADINQEALSIVNEEGAGQKNNRARWVNKVSKKAQDVLQQIDILDARLENEELSETERSKLLKERAAFDKKMEKITTISRKPFLGKRYKRWLFLLSRKGQETYLKGTTYADTSTTGHWLWDLSIQENILERAFIQESFQKTERTPSRVGIKPDEVRTFLAKEFVEKIKHPNTDEKRHILSVEHVLMDIENIFNPSLTTRERYLLTLLVEVVLTGFFEHHLRLIYNKLAIPSANLNIWQKIKAKAKLRAQIEPFIKYAFFYSDFLRTISLINNKAKINAYKYEAMENVLIFFEYLNRLSQLAKSNSTQEQIIAALDQKLHRIKAGQVHREKSTIRSWIPFRAPLPWCRNLVMRF
ncbi:MAG: hypothetical protein OXM55_00155 [Bdellovibrionales bacterium]|nr:hypothetical protein [Bdellovibrionales bacterium]